MLRKFSVAALACALTFAFLGGGVARADDANPFANIQIDVTPYVWAPTVNATFRHPLAGVLGPDGQPIAPPGATFDASIGPSQVLAKLNFALMGAMQVHFGDLSLYGDFINVNLSGGGLTNVRNIGNTAYTVGGTAGGQVVTTLWTLAPGFRVFHNKLATVDIIAGAQTLWQSSNGQLQLTGPLGNTFSSGFNQFQGTTAFVAGTTGHIGLTDKLSVPFFFDYGFGTPSSLQWLLGVKYGAKSGIVLAWRTIQFNTTSTTDILQNMNLSGPLLGYTIAF